jgi:hypothetical protein
MSAPASGDRGRRDRVADAGRDPAGRGEARLVEAEGALHSRGAAMGSPRFAPRAHAASVAVAAAPRLLLVATDWDREMRAADYAIARSQRGPALRVDVLHASAPVIAWRAWRFWAYARVISWQREQGELLLRAHHARLARAGLAATCHLRIDEPARAITRLAAEVGAECVVLPTPPSTELARFRYWWDVHKIVGQSGTPVVLA